MNAEPTSARGVAARVISGLAWSGIEHAVAVRVTQELIAHAQQAIIANGATGDGSQIAALLNAATAIVIGYATNKERFSYEQLMAAVQGAPALRVVRAAPKGE